MSVVVTSRDAYAVPAGAGGRMRKRANFGLPSPTAGATALTLAGPGSGNRNSASLAFVVGANGSVGGTTAVSIAVTGVAGTLSVVTVNLLPSAPTASFTFTPSAEGVATVTVTAAGLAPASAQYTSLPAGAPAVAIPNWYVWLSPEKVWEQPDDTVPAGASFGSGGQPNRLRLNHEADAYDDTLYVVDTGDPDGTWNGSAPSGITLTPTELQRGFVTPTYATLRRITHPTNGAKKAFEHRLDKAQLNIAANPVTKFRAEVTSTGAQRRTPFQQETWAVVGLYLPTAMLLEDSSETPGGYYTIITQFHDDGGGLGGNPPISLRMVGGNGNAAAARIDYEIKQYNGAGWPTAPVKGSTLMASGTAVVAPAASTWHYFAFHTRSNCDFSDPVLGDIYGPNGAGNSNGFVRIYHAEGAGDPVQVVNYHGYWNAPYPPGEQYARAEDLVGGYCPTEGYWKCGIYSRNRWLPAAAGDLRSIITLGVKQWRVVDNPGIDVWSVLEDFRA